MRKYENEEMRKYENSVKMGVDDLPEKRESDAHERWR